MKRGGDGWRTVATLALIVSLGFAIRFTIWIYPMYGVQSLLIFDTGSYPIFGLAYIHAITTMNFTALTSINPGVPPIGMLLTGLSTQTFGELIGPIQASLIPPVTASALTAIPAYLIAKRYAGRAALLAPALVSFDPFLIQFSATYLDSIGTLFAAASAAYVIDSSSRRSFSLAIFFATLAALTKLSFTIFTAIFALLLLLNKELTARRAILYLLIPPASLVLSPGVWRPSNIGAIVEGHLAFNNVPLAPLLSPFVIDVPLSLPWHILSYLGMGQVSWNTLPHVTPLAVLLMVAYQAARNELRIPRGAAIPASAIVLAIFLLPRGYWTYSWAGGAVQGVLARQFYPYYFYPVGPFLAVLAAAVFASDAGHRPAGRLATYPALLAALVSPLAVVMSFGLPYWDFIFNLIYSASQGSWMAEGIAAAGITTAILAAVLAAAELIHRRAQRIGG